MASSVALFALYLKENNVHIVQNLNESKVGNTEFGNEIVKPVKF